ncbi:class I SAM-dependent methyltransferase [Patescibacteria group bacterium]|nr:class I SAM-dependent methyltransferase [Patescibacteria group bacterium]
MNDAEFIGKVFAQTVGGDLNLYATKYKRGFGHLGNRPRLEVVAEYCAKKWPGDIAEIGVLHGNTHRLLAEVARKHGRRTIAVDPFNVDSPGYQKEGYGMNYYQYFLDNTEEWRDTIDIVKLSSMDPKAIEYLENRPLCFAYVDGLHTYDACYSDILAVRHCAGIIAVDDIHIKDQVHKLMKAFWDAATVLNRIPMDNSLSREGYLLPGDK